MLEYRPVVFLIALALLASIYFLFTSSESELAPTEDQGILFVQAKAPQSATIDYDEAYAHQMLDLFATFPEYEESFLILGQAGDPTAVFAGFKMTPAAERTRSQMDVQPELQRELDSVAGFEIGVFPRSSPPGASSGVSVQFVVTADAGYRELLPAVDELIERASRSGKFAFLSKSIRFARPVATIVVDRNKAGDLGVTMEDIGRDLAVMLSSGRVNWFSLGGRSYEVIPQVARRYRLDTRMLDDYYIRSGSGKLVPLSALVAFKKSVEPSKRTQFQQLNAVTIEGVMQTGVTLGNAIDYLEAQAREVLPRNFGWDYTGPSRQYVQEGQELLITFLLALIVIYLVLAAQFESWRDPLIILISVPMSIAGAMAFLALGFATLNIYTQVGLISLIGLMAKNGILIVEFANQLQLNEGLDKRQAVEEAARIRLRPILMTTVSLIVAMIPLIMATGAGAVSRYHIGLVLASGLSIGTVLTLFVVPAFYILIGQAKSSLDA